VPALLFCDHAQHDTTMPAQSPSSSAKTKTTRARQACPRYFEGFPLRIPRTPNCVSCHRWPLPPGHGRMVQEVTRPPRSHPTRGEKLMHRGLTRPVSNAKSSLRAFCPLPSSKIETSVLSVNWIYAPFLCCRCRTPLEYFNPSQRQPPLSPRRSPRLSPRTCNPQCVLTLGFR
jgi:hypothetical protein